MCLYSVFDRILGCFCAKYAHFRAKLEVHLQQQKNSLKTFYMWKSLIYIVTIQHYKFCQRTVSIFFEPLLGAINTTLYKNLRHHCSGAKDDIVCRKDGVLRLAEPGSGENLSCVVVFILVSQKFVKPIKGLLAGFEVNLFKVSCVLNS